MIVVKERRQMVVSCSEYLKELKSRIREDEWKALENNGIDCISSYNRETLLRMLHDDRCGSGTMDTEQADALEKALEAYLAQYMAENPQGHKWIIISCLYLSQIVREPMHPQKITGWHLEGDRYVCSAREDLPGSLCRWCICR